VWEFYSERRVESAKSQPNPAHIALAELERQLGDRFFLCTQNVDDLHEQPVLGGWCICTANYPRRTANGIAVARRSRSCDLSQPGRGRPLPCGGRLRPHIVFFGEMPLEMERIEQEIAKATLMVVVGTSGSVYPAANFVHWRGKPERVPSTLGLSRR